MKWTFFALLIYALFFATGQGGMEDPILQAFLSGEFGKLDPLVTMVFSFLGIFPFFWTALYFRSDQYAVPAWPFALLSFGLGAFALLPYLFFRKKEKKARPRVQNIGYALSSRWAMLTLLLITLFLYIYGLLFGSFIGYKEAFLQSSLVSVMTVDFLLLVIYSWWWIRKEAPGKEWLCFFPLSGALIACAISLRKDRQR
ncbi:hypothetical protein [Metabacillus sp. 84]|uniref:hypothetical protein n=1 Tax=Metabacillus sp. 84 TaxID=3404705 RepID=UPI003CEDC590